MLIIQRTMCCRESFSAQTNGLPILYTHGLCVAGETL